MNKYTITYEDGGELAAWSCLAIDEQDAVEKFWDSFFQDDAGIFIKSVKMTMKNPLRFISIASPCGRVSSLSIGGNQDRGCLTVVGNLEHNYQFIPTTAQDRDKLVEFLEGLKYESED